MSPDLPDAIAEDSAAKRRLAADEFSKSQTFLDSLIENIPDMIFVKDAKELRFVRLNRAGEELLGFPREEMIGKNDYDFFTKQEAAFFTGKDRDVLRSGEMHEVLEEPIHTRHRGVRILHTKKIPLLDEQKVPRYLLGISEDVTERRALERKILEISEREQRRIGQDLHDGLGQHLAGIAFMSTALREQLAASKHPSARAAATIVELIGQAVVQTRDLARVLYPIELESNGLAAALQDLALTTRGMFRVGCAFLTDGRTTVSDKTIASHLYRVAQESLSNALRHSKAQMVTISLSQREQTILLEIKDDGVGVQEDSLHNTQGMGFSIMQYRARMIGAVLDVHPDTERGTVVSCSVPLTSVLE